VVGTTSRRTSSWYFGDGAALLNQVSATLGLGPSIAPLDGAVHQPLSERRRGATFGFRLNRSFLHRFGAEFTLEYSRGRLMLRQAALADVEAARASFVPAWTALIGTGPFMNPTVTSVTTLNDRVGRQILATGTLNVDLRTSGRAIPYVSLGAGLKANQGGTPSVSLEGNYRFQILGVYPVNETDSVTLRTSIANAAVGVVGGGVRFFFSPRWGMRFDIRALVSKASIGTVIDTRSRPAPLTAPAGAPASLSTPSVQFSNNGTLGPSSLAGPQLTGFRGFSSRGWESQTNITSGLFVRF
jgi:hypothetical protein